MLKPVREAFDRLEGKTSTPAYVKPYATIYRDVVRKTPIRVGPEAAQVKETTAATEDVNGDGCVDQVVHVVTTMPGLTLQPTQLCLAMTLPNGRAESSCDAIRAQRT